MSLSALILVGGFGTRLRPLTLSRPKPLVEFINRPIIEHQIEALVAVGVTKIVLAVNYQPQSMIDAIKIFEQKYDVKIVMSQETEPLGTAGPLALAREHLMDGRFFVLNSDVICDYPLSQMLMFHSNHGKQGTMLVTRVEEPSKYGVVIHEREGLVRHFVEKPQTFVGNHINAGIYLFEHTVLDRIVPKPHSLEKEIFPLMAEEEQLCAILLPGYWMDIGQPHDYLKGMQLHLDYLGSQKMIPPIEQPAYTVIGNVIVHPSAIIESNAVIGPNVVIGPECHVATGARIHHSTLLGHVKVKAHALVMHSIIGWSSCLGSWSRIENTSVIGEDVQVDPMICVNGALVLPHKTVSQSIYTPKTIVM